jgi:hypothetical protein
MYGFQRPGHPPAFEVFAGHVESAVPSYVRYLEEAVREAFDMHHTPLQLVFKVKAVPTGNKKRHPRARKARGKVTVKIKDKPRARRRP